MQRAAPLDGWLAAGWLLAGIESWPGLANSRNWPLAAAARGKLATRVALAAREAQVQG